jgi:two-component system alkaline phosphatase synthesis response regulator PhoP
MSTAAPLRALIVEDDADIGQLVARYLQKAGFVTTALTSGRDVLAQARREPPDVILLDVMLPGMDGLELCRALRTDTTTALVPIILLTARDGEDERIAGLETGADDYITKPFSPKEVVARVRALLRRTHRTAPAAPTITYGPLTVDVERHIVRHGGADVHVTAKEFLLLQYLLEHRGRVLSRDLLLTDVWGYAYTGGTRTVDVHIRRLREKLPVLVDAIVTIKQFGYKLLDPPPEA